MVWGLAQALPPLREELRLYEAAPKVDGSPSWTIQDPVKNAFVSIGWMEFELLLRWHLAESNAIIKRTNEETPLAVTAQEFEEFRKFLSARQLLAEHSFDHTNQLMEFYQKSRNSRTELILKNYLFFRIPLWHPQRWLAATLPWVNWIFERWVVYALILTGMAALYLTVQQLDVFAASFVDTLSPQGIAGYLAALFVTKSLHELAHAYTATRFGVRVAHMGVAFLVLWPVLYTDTGESWRIKNNIHRLSIASAGVVVELALAIMALFAWNWVQPGAFRDGLFFLSTTAWVLSLAINASPFMRFDGYFILSDFLDMPNLHERSAAMARMWIRNFLLGWNEPSPEDASPTRRRFLIAFSCATWLYRFTLFIAIAIAVYLFFFKVLGIFLFAVEIWWFILRPMMKEVGVWHERRVEIKRRNRVIALLIFGFLMTLGIYPWDRHINASAWSHSARAMVLYSPLPARIDNMPVRMGATEKGAPLFLLGNPDSDMRAAQAVVTQKALEKQLIGLMGVPDGEARRASLQRLWKVSRAQQNAEVNQTKRLRILSAMKGLVADIDPKLSPGVWVNPNQPLAVVFDPDHWMADAYVSQEERSRIALDNKVLFYGRINPLSPTTGRIVEIDTNRTVSLPNALMSSKYGGDIAVEADESGLTPKETLYRVRIALDTPPDQLQVSRGNVVIEAESHSIFVKIFKSLAVVVVRESSF